MSQPPVVQPSDPEAAADALRRIARAWELDRSDVLALVRASANDLSTMEWTEDRRIRVAYLIELEKALLKLDPKGGIARWIAAAKPGPFFRDQSPLQMLMGSTQEMAELLQQVRLWGGARH